MRIRAGWVLALGAAAGAAYAADVFVSPTGDDTAGCGATSDTACQTIQFAVGVAQQTGDSIRVLPGTYGECVNAGSKSVAIVADDCLTDLDPCLNTAIVDGTGICTSAAVVLLGPTSSLRGFTVRGGGATGVQAFGDVVITKNEIRENDGLFGGGIYLFSGAGVAGDHLAVIENNLIEDNTAEVDGGGIFAAAAAIADNSRQEIRITNNTILNNVGQGFPEPTTLYPGGFGGGISTYTFSTVLGQAEIAITGNVIEGNSVEANSPGYYGNYYGSYGGGIWAGTYGYGSDTIRISDNQGIRNNTAVNTGGGISAIANGRDAAIHTIEIADNSVSNNGADNGGGGVDLTMSTLDHTGSLAVEIKSNELTGNRGDGFFGGGGLTATMVMRRTDNPTSALSIEGNSIRNNRTDTFGGGASLLIVANADPDFGGATARTTAVARLRNNLVSNNRADNASNTALGGGVAMELQAFGDALAEAELDFDTVSSNVADGGGGGLEVLSVTDVDAGAGISEGLASLVLTSSIVSSNTGFGVGGPPPAGTGNFVSSIRYNDVFGNSAGDYEATFGDQTGLNGNISLDPLLDANFVPDVCSLTVDAADPAADFSLEPEPNGDRANQGHLGGTAEAVRNLPDTGVDGTVDGLDILNVAVAFGSNSAQTTRYNPNADVDLDGDVDGDDLAIVAAFFGRACP